MDIIPVLDIMGQTVVHGFQGLRSQYRPVESILTPSADPLILARALEAETRCRAIYIADLDAIQNQGDNFPIIRDLVRELEPEIWVDAGIARHRDLEALVRTRAHAVVLGSESLTSRSELRRILDQVSPDQVILSLDLKEGKLLSPMDQWKGQDPEAAMAEAMDMGVNRFILLPLDKVGTARGSDLELLGRIRRRFPHTPLITGGGVKNPDHLAELHHLGMDGVLLATSLHRGWIRSRDLEALE